MNLILRDCKYIDNKNSYLEYYFDTNPFNKMSFDKSINNINITDLYEQKLIKQINLALMHGIYGFGFYLYISENIIYFDKYPKI